MLSKAAFSVAEEFRRQVGIIEAVIKGWMAYRFDLFMALLGSLLTMAMVYFLWTSIYHSAVSMDMTYSALITYVCLGQACSFARPGQRQMIVRIGYGIRSGQILMDLVRPTDYQLMVFTETLGAYLMEFLMVSLPSFLLALLVFGISPPASPEAGIGFLVSLAGAVFLILSFDFLIGLMAFWTFNVWGLGYAKIAVLDILAGTIIPLSLFPDGLRNIVMALPFKDMAYTPLAIYIGQISGGAIWTSILVQFIWGIVLVLLTRLIWTKARRRIEIQGG
jgi:ABC-2 type transport system permease protein